MTLFNISFRNIKKNFQIYFIYFISMVFSIMVFYVFSSIQYNEQVVATVGMTTSTMLRVGAVAIAVFSTIFMGYSHAFFTRKRKKEIGLYTLLGLQRKQVARMLFYENLVMGILALLIGIIIGSVFSKVFLMLFLAMMGHFVRVYFSICPQAIINTVLVFLVLFFIISLHAYSLIYRFKLVDLFRSEQSGETEPKASVLLALISILMITAGYVLAFNVLRIPNFLLYAVSVLTLVIAGTYGLFRSFMVFTIKLSRKNKPKYYKGMNLISTSNLLYRIKSNAFMLATIAILSASTLTGVGMCYGFYHNINEEVALSNPFSYVYWTNPERDQKVEQILSKHPENQLLNSIDIGFISADGTIPGTFFNTPFNFALISESNYNDLAEIKGWDKININNRNEAVLVQSFYMAEDFIGKETILELDEKSKLHLQIADIKSFKLSNNFNTWTSLIVKDDVYNKQAAITKPDFLRAMIVSKQKDSQALTAELEEILSPGVINSYYTEYMWYMESFGMLMFIGGFLGLVILFATGSIIYFRQLNEAEKERTNYRILRNIGVSRQEIKTSISKQVFYIFLFPLLLGIAHSSAALGVLSDMVGMSLVVSTIITIAIYTLIYLFYYLLTVHSYNKTVNS